MNRRIVLWRERQPILNRAMTADLGRHSVASLTIFCLFAKVISYLGNGYLPLLHLIFFSAKATLYLYSSLLRQCHFFATPMSFLCYLVPFLNIYIFEKKLGWFPGNRCLWGPIHVAWRLVGWLQTSQAPEMRAALHWMTEAAWLRGYTSWRESRCCSASESSTAGKNTEQAKQSISLRILATHK